MSRRARALASTVQGIITFVLASASCDDSGIDDRAFSCEGPLPDYTTNLKPAVPVDYVEIRTQQFKYPAEPGEVISVGQKGNACASGSNPTACFAALETARAGNGSGWYTRHDNGDPRDPSPRQFLVFTRGDDVGVIDSADELVAFLGSIETLEEARLLLATRTFPLRCQTEPFKTGWKRSLDGSWRLIVDASSCGNEARVLWKVSVDGVITQLEREEFSSGSVCGRRPEGLVPTASGAEVSIGAWLAEAAHLEAASVTAFRRLERELRCLGAPLELLTQTRRARADEIRHAREMTALARRFGAEPAPVRVTRETQRRAFEIALENAVEGCVRETYGALVASYQARTAGDRRIRSVLERIARDEIRHAALAHDTAAWLEPRFTSDERRAIAEARASALADLRSALRRTPAADVSRLGGLPGPRDASALLDLLEAQVLRAA